MKVCIIFCGLLAVTFAKSKLQRTSSTPQIVDMIKYYGYNVETYTVTTQDGYILDLFRIPRSVHPLPHQHEDSVNLNEDDLKHFGLKSKQFPVLLMHGFMSSSEDFVFNRFAFFLADKGFDVYLGNARGSRYGQRHTTLDPHRDAAYWKFCFDEMGTKDLPAIIDKVLDVSQQEKLSYIGHMEGTTSFYVMGSAYSEYLNKVDRMIALGPIAFMKYSNNILLKTISEHMSKGWLIKNIGMNSLKFSDNLLDEVKDRCHNSNLKICENPFFLFNGYNSEQFNKTIIDEVMDRLPFGGAAREVIHFAQLLASGHFQKFNDDFQSQSPILYDLTKVKVPVALFYTSNDSLSNVEDVQKLIEELPSVYLAKPLYNYVNNLDLVYGKQLSRFLFNEVCKCLSQDIPTMNFI